MRKERWIAAALVVSALGFGVMAGCGGGGEKAPDTASTEKAEAPETPAGEATEAAGAAGEISLAVGEKVVAERCVLCHGTSGKGDGPGGAALNPKPRDWTEHGYMETRTDDQLYDVIYNGKGSMPAWGKTGILTESEIRSAILKVRTYDPAHKG